MWSGAAEQAQQQGAQDEKKQRSDQLQSLLGFQQHGVAGAQQSAAAAGVSNGAGNLSLENILSQPMQSTTNPLAHVGAMDFGGLAALGDGGAGSDQTAAAASVTARQLLQIQQQQQQQQPRVKVKCESCHVLLEVVVPPNHPQETMIVRCGNCSSLLEVMLRQPGHIQQHALGGLGPGGLSDPLGGLGYPPHNQHPVPLHLGGGHADALGGGHAHMGGLPYNHQYNMLHHQNMNPFEDMRRSQDVAEELRRAGQLSMLANYTGGSAAEKRRWDFENPDMGNKRGKRGKRQRDPNKPKKLSKYNEFVSMEVKRLKASKENHTYKEMFKIAAVNWRTSPMNPINAGKVASAAEKAAKAVVKVSIDCEGVGDALVQLKLAFVGEAEAVVGGGAVSDSACDHPAESEGKKVSSGADTNGASEGTSVPEAVSGKLLPPLGA